jgi:hypothetical protein
MGTRVPLHGPQAHSRIRGFALTFDLAWLPYVAGHDKSSKVIARSLAQFKAAHRAFFFTRRFSSRSRSYSGLTPVLFTPRSLPSFPLPPVSIQGYKPAARQRTRQQHQDYARVETWWLFWLHYTLPRPERRIRVGKTFWGSVSRYKRVMRILFYNKWQTEDERWEREP